MNIDFNHLLATAKRQTGKNFPTPKEVREAFARGEAARAVCATTHALQDLPNDATISDTDNEHYLVEEIIIEACMEIFEVQQRRRR